MVNFYIIYNKYAIYYKETQKNNNVNCFRKMITFLNKVIKNNYFIKITKTFFIKKIIMIKEHYKLFH